MKRINLSTQAIQSLRADAARPNAHQRDRRLFSWFADCLMGGVKFVIPDANTIFDGGDTTRGMELVRLPYPVTVLEYVVEGPADDAELATPRRIALCFSPSSRSLDEIEGVCQLPTRSDEDGIYVVAMFEDHGVWFCPPVLSFVRSESDPIANPRRTASNAKWAQRFQMIALPIESMLSCYAETGERLAHELLHDVHDEVNAAVTVCKLMNCSNVHEEVTPAPKAINAARARKGKLPLFEYRTLVIDVAATPKGGADSRGEASGRASPRQHLRRGHIRRLSDRVIWVNAAVVGATGWIEKDYKVRGRK